MAYNLLLCDRGQGCLMPPSSRLVGTDGVQPPTTLPRQVGVGVLLYAYCQGIRSSRRIARALERDVGFRVMAANQQPDFRTICRFRADHEEALERLFVQVLRLCREAPTSRGW